MRRSVSGSSPPRVTTRSDAANSCRFHRPCGAFRSHRMATRRPPDAPAAAWVRARRCFQFSKRGAAFMPLGKLPFVSEVFLRRLVGEAHRQARVDRRSRRRARDRASGRHARRTCGEPPTARGRISHVGIRGGADIRRALRVRSAGAHASKMHVDSRGYEIAVHVLLEHTVASSGNGPIDFDRTLAE